MKPWMILIIVLMVWGYMAYRRVLILRLKFSLRSMGENLTNERVERFIMLVKRVTVTNHPDMWNSLRAGFQMVNQSPSISSDLKKQLMNVLLSKGVNLGNVRIFESEEERRTNKELRKKQSGENGEREVQYNLKWLPSDTYRILHNVRIPHYIEPQEFDHIVIGPNAIFHLETKNYGGEEGGNIVINKDGDWCLNQFGNSYGLENPLQQVNRHSRVLNDFIVKEFADIRVPIQEIVVVSNKKTTLEGAENTPLKVLKVERLNNYIENYNKEVRMDNKNIELLYKELSKFTIKKEKAV
jgi:hypothetical protein